MLRELYYVPQWQGSCSELTAAAHPRNVHLGDKWFPGSPPLGNSCLCSLVLYRGADKSFARPGRKQANVSVRMACISFGVLPYRGGGDLMTARVSMLFKSRASLTCFQACFLTGRAKDLSAPR